MNIIEMIEKYFYNLFTNYFNEIDITSELINNYNWSNISCIFEFLYKKLILFENSSDFTKNYYLITLYFINYTNFIKYIKHPDSELKDIYVFLNKIKYNPDIINYISQNILDKDIDNIFGTFSPFIKTKIKVLNNKINKKQFNDFIENVKHLDKIYFHKRVFYYIHYLEP